MTGEPKSGDRHGRIAEWFWNPDTSNLHKPERDSYLAGIATGERRIRQSGG